MPLNTEHPIEKPCTKQIVLLIEKSALGSYLTPSLLTCRFFIRVDLFTIEWCACRMMVYFTPIRFSSISRLLKKPVRDLVTFSVDMHVTELSTFEFVYDRSVHQRLLRNVR